MSFETLKNDLNRITRRVTEYKYVDAKQMAKDNILPFLESFLEEVTEQFAMFSEAIDEIHGDATIIQQQDGLRIANLLVICKTIYDTLPEGQVKTDLMHAMHDVSLLLEESVAVEEETEETEETEEDTETEETESDSDNADSESTESSKEG